MSNRTLQSRMGHRTRRVLLRVLRPFDELAQRVVTPRPNRVFYASMPDYTDNAYAVYRHLIETRHDLEHVWLLRNMDLAHRIRREFAGSEARGHSLVLKRWEPRSYFTFLRSQYVVHTHGVYGFSKPAHGRSSVCVWHGMPVKAIGRLHPADELYPLAATVHLSTSSFFRYVIAGVFAAHPDEVLVSGLPRTDVLKGKMPTRHTREQIATRLGVDPSKRWLLWMPTHRSEASSVAARPARTLQDAVDPQLIAALAEAAEAHDTEVIVKLHPFDLLNRNPTEFPHPGLTLVTAAHWEATAVQLYDLVACADGLITDISSIFIDYLHTGNPIGLIGFDEASYTRHLLFDPALMLRCRAAAALNDPASVHEFVGRIGTTRIDPTEDDFATMFIEDHEIASSESVATAIGL